MGDTLGDAPAAGGDTAAEGTAPAADPATQGGSEPSGAHTADPAGSTPAPATEGGTPPAKAKKAKAPQAEPAKAGPDLTARLASMSKDNREARKELVRTNRALEQASQRLTDFETLIQRAQSGDDTAIDDVYNRFGLSFERIVNYHAGKPDPTPEEARNAEIAELRKRLDDDATARQRERDEAKAASDAAREEAARGEYVGMCVQHIKAAAEKAEICGRLGDEAAQAVFGRVVNAWAEAGQPTLMPGELEEAIDEAIRVQELEYEKRGQLLAKKLNGTNGHANGVNGKSSELPAGLTGSKLSDTDETILNGLIDKSAPGATSQRAKPRSISSQMGGSAPPKTAPRGGQDARDALRDTLAQFNLLPR